MYFWSIISFNPHNCGYYYPQMRKLKLREVKVPSSPHCTQSRGCMSDMHAFLLTQYSENCWLPVHELRQSNFRVLALPTPMVLKNWSPDQEHRHHPWTWQKCKILTPVPTTESIALGLGPSNLSEQAPWVSEASQNLRTTHTSLLHDHDGGNQEVQSVMVGASSKVVYSGWTESSLSQETRALTRRPAKVGELRRLATFRDIVFF